MIERKEKEKIETKGAYSHDLHEAIRDVRRAFANDNRSRIGSRLNALFDICAPEIREAINEEWLKIDEKYSEQLELCKNAEYEVDNLRPKKMWEEKYDGSWVRNVWVDVPTMSIINTKEVAKSARNSDIGKVWDTIYRERFRACIDCLDRHGELRKWREVEYGKV